MCHPENKLSASIYNYLPEYVPCGRGLRLEGDINAVAQPCLEAAAKRSH